MDDLPVKSSFQSLFSCTDFTMASLSFEERAFITLSYCRDSSDCRPNSFQVLNI